MPSGHINKMIEIDGMAEYTQVNATSATQVSYRQLNQQSQYLLPPDMYQGPAAHECSSRTQAVLLERLSKQQRDALLDELTSRCSSVCQVGRAVSISMIAEDGRPMHSDARYLIAEELAPRGELNNGMLCEPLSMSESCGRAECSLRRGLSLIHWGHGSSLAANLARAGAGHVLGGLAATLLGLRSLGCCLVLSRLLHPLLHFSA